MLKGRLVSEVDFEEGQPEILLSPGQNGGIVLSMSGQRQQLIRKPFDCFDIAPANLKQT